MQLTRREMEKFEAYLRHRYPGQRGEIYHGEGGLFRGGGDRAEGEDPHHSAAKPPVPEAAKIRQKTQNRLGRDLYHPKRYGNGPEADLDRDEKAVQISRRGA